MSDPTKNYARAMAVLAKAEASHQEALDAIDEAKTAGRSDKLPRLRMQAQESERHLSECLADAERAHRGYWLSRRIKLVPDLIRLARVALEYDVMARASGDSTVWPWKNVFDAEMVKGFAHEEIVQQVPLAGPESELLTHEYGAWR